ncbi:hypothetical protein BT93_H1574 [Corymbia citriodora subsp. variegata]|nr:hypothetical protein BT93_H1574 [Corymbia citriodora subsp. variegata]
MCSQCKKHSCWRPCCRRRPKIIIIIITIIITISITVSATLLAREILRPRKPRLTLQDITIPTLNVSFANNNQTFLLNSTFQITLSSRNPHGNPRSILYDDLRVYMSYHDQQITLAMRLPPTYQPRGGSDVWSPLVYGPSVPIDRYTALALNQDISNGFVMMKVKLQGHVSWRPGIFTSGSFISVDCPAYITTASQNNGLPLAIGAVKYRLMQSCSVSL